MEEGKLELREKELVAQRKLEEVGKGRIRKVVEEVPDCTAPLEPLSKHGSEKRVRVR